MTLSSRPGTSTIPMSLMRFDGRGWMISDPQVFGCLGCCGGRESGVWRESEAIGFNKIKGRLIILQFQLDKRPCGISVKRHTEIHTHTHTHTPQDVCRSRHVGRGGWPRQVDEGDKQGAGANRKEQESEAGFISTSTGGRPPT